MSRSHELVHRRQLRAAPPHPPGCERDCTQSSRGPSRGGPGLDPSRAREVKPGNVSEAREPHLQLGFDGRRFESRERATAARRFDPRDDCGDRLRPRSELDPRLEIDHSQDAIINKRMASVFHDTLIPSLLVWHKIDTVILTGGSTSGCIRASAIASLSTGYRTIVPEETTADKHEIPHFANLCDIMLKYADVEPVQSVKDWLSNHPGCEPIRQARGGSF
jgi:hypothetical protein